jgi:DNA-binding GntR family transcriptional regulator
MAKMTAAETGAERIRGLIASGRLHAGEPLREEQLSSDLGMSRTPLREAIARLKAEGILVSDRNRSAIVFKPSMEDLREIYDIRVALESLAARLAAVKATHDERLALQDLLSELDCTPPGNAWVRLNREFHQAIYSAARRPRLLRMIDTLRTQSEPYVRMLVSLGHSHDAQEGHRHMLKALLDRDGDAAAKAVADHLSSTVDHVMSELEDREG